MALAFNGSTSKLACSSGLVTSYPVTIFAWVKPGSLTADGFVAGAGDFGGADTIAIQATGSLAGDPMRAFERRGSPLASVAAASDDGMSLGSWQPVMAVFESSNNRRIYFADGDVVKNVSNIATNFATFDNFTVGCYPLTHANLFTGSVAHVAVWSAAFNDAHFGLLRGGLSPDAFTDSLVEHWSLHDVSDLTGVNGNLFAPTSVTTDASGPTVSEQPGPLRFSFETPVDGGWSRFTSPVAVHDDVAGATYFGWVNASGFVGISSINPTTKEAVYAALSSWTQSDMHNNPALQVRASDGRIAAFYCRHPDLNGVYMRVSSNPHDVSTWGAESLIPRSGYQTTYSNVFELSAPGKVYCYGRAKHTASGVFSHRVLHSSDYSTWSDSDWIIRNATDQFYAVLLSDGVDRVDIFLSDNHPAIGPTSLYHCYMQLDAGVEKFYKSDGALIGTAPISPSDCTLVYDGSTVSGFPRDIVRDVSGDLCVLFSSYPGGESDTRHMWAKLSSGTWGSPVQIAAVGPVTWPGYPSSDGELCFDQTNTDTVFLSIKVGDAWEIQEHATSDGGSTWAKVRDVTSGGAAGTIQIQPVSPRNASEELRVLWYGGTASLYNNYSTKIQGEFSAPIVGGDLLISSSIHANASGQPALHSNLFLSAAGAAHAVVSEAPTLNTGVELAADSAQHDIDSESAVLSSNSNIQASDAAHGHAADAAALSSQHTLQSAGALHSVSSDNIDLFSGLSLDSVGATHAVSADGVVISSASFLQASDAFHGHVADGLTLSAVLAIVVASAAHSVASDNATLDSGTALSVNDATHSLASEAPAIYALLTLQADDAQHALSSEAFSLSAALSLVIDDIAHSVASDDVALNSGALLSPDGANHAYASDVASLSTALALVIEDALHGHLADGPSLYAALNLAISDALHAHSAAAANLNHGAAALSVDRTLAVAAEVRRLVVALESRRWLQ